MTDARVQCRVIGKLCWTGWSATPLEDDYQPQLPVQPRNVMGIVCVLFEAATGINNGLIPNNATSIGVFTKYFVRSQQ